MDPLSYEELVEIAKRHPPPQSWFEEDFSGLGGPEKGAMTEQADNTSARKSNDETPEQFVWLGLAVVAFFAVLLACLPARADAPTPILMNLAAPYGWLSSDPFVDKANLCRPYGSPAAPWDESVPLASYVGGYPVGDFGGYLDCAGLKAGTYDVTYKGTGRIAWSNATASTATTVDLAPGRPVWFSVTGTARGDPFRDFHVVRRGENAGSVFTDEFLADLRGVACVRMMDWGRTNEIQPQTFAQRQTTAGTQTTTRGVCLEHQIALANALGADLWLCIPDWADDAYVAETAKMVAAGLDKKLNVYVEVSNENWNGNFPQFNRLLTAAQNNPELTATDRYERLYQHIAFRERAAVVAFRGQGVVASRLRPILSGQAVNAWWVDSALKFLDAKYGAGTAADVVWAVAYADYWRPSYAQETTSPTLDNLLASLAASVVTDATANLMAHKATGAKYGVNRVVTYEGGEHVTDRVYSDSGASQLLNHALHLAMQRDPRMGVAYKVGIDQFFKGGGTMWGAYCSTSSWGTGEWGYWGLGETLADDTPKRQAVRAYYATAIPPPVAPPVTPPTVPTTTFPVAVWQQPARNVAMLAGLGINTFVGPETENAKSLTPAALAAGNAAWVKAVQDVGGRIVYRKPPPGPLPAGTIAVILSVDEPNGKAILPAALKAESDDLRQRYPGVPVVLSLAGDKITSANFTKPDQAQLYRDYAALADVLTVDVYAMNRNADRYKVTWTADAVRSLIGVTGKPVWGWVECNDQRLPAPTTPPDQNRAPTPDEIEQTVNAALSAGVTGIGWFGTCDSGAFGWPQSYWSPTDRNGVSMIPQYAAVQRVSNRLAPPPVPATQPSTQPTTQPSDLAPILAKLDAQAARIVELEQNQRKQADSIVTAQDSANKAQADAAAANNVWDAMVKARQAATQPSGGTK